MAVDYKDYYKILASLIEGEGTGGELRYSEEEVAQLRRIRRLQHDLGVNLAGVEVILHLLKLLEALNQKLELERSDKQARPDSMNSLSSQR